MPEAVVVEAVRTPIGRRKGSLAEVHPVDLSAAVLRALVDRTGVDPALVDDVVWGCVNQVGDQAAQIGRYAVLAAGWPESVPGVTVNRACGSSQSAFDFAAGMVLAGQYDLVVAGGVESMTRVPLGAGRDLGRPYGPLVRERYAGDLTSGEFPGGDFHQGVGAERIAAEWGLSRRRLDEYAARSHERAVQVDAHQAHRRTDTRRTRGGRAQYQTTYENAAAASASSTSTSMTMRPTQPTTDGSPTRTAGLSDPGSTGHRPPRSSAISRARRSRSGSVGRGGRADTGVRGGGTYGGSYGASTGGS